ncbi:MAG TPA: ABC transporter permease [Candidatus Dormibacteraeota bacterium]|nr:ABC transporter permease [Candidatus Dormibacteraeota bacterium]
MGRPRPLSVFTYYARNKRKTIPLLIILTLAVALMMVVQSLVGSARDTAYAIFGSYGQVEVVAPRVNSSQDAYKPIAATLDSLKQQRAKLAAGGTADANAAGSLAQVMQQMQDVQAYAKELQSLPQQLRATTPSTAALEASLGGASQHGRNLQADLTRLSAELQQAQRQQSQQQELLALLDRLQKNPNDLDTLVAYLQQPHDFTSLLQPDTTNYQAISDDASRAAASAGALSNDLNSVQGQTAALRAAMASASAAVTLPTLPKLSATLPNLPPATGALDDLNGQLGELQQKLEALGGPQGNIDAIESKARALPGVDKVLRDTYSNIDLNMLAGNANFDLFGLTEQDTREVMGYYGDRVSAGRLPRQDAAEIVLSEEVARARGVKIGDLVGSDVNELDSLPEHFKIVGLLSGPVRLGFIPREYMVSNYFGARRFQALVVLPKPGQLESSRAGLHDIVNGQPYRIFDGPFVQGKIDDLLVNLQRIDDFLTLAVALTLALVIGLLNNLYFRQRMNEFGLLAALGYPRRQLSLKVVTESALVVLGAWVLGGIVGAAALAWFDATYMYPHGLVLRVFDPGILMRATLPVPVMVLVFSLGTLLWQLWRLDPIAIIERRD